MKDDNGVVQLWTVSPNGGEPRRITRNTTNIGSAFTWSPDGRWITHVLDARICITDVSTGDTCFLTGPANDHRFAPRPEACVFSPDGQNIAFVRPVLAHGEVWNQIFVVTVDPSDTNPEFEKSKR